MAVPRGMENGSPAVILPGAGAPGNGVVKTVMKNDFFLYLSLLFWFGDNHSLVYSVRNFHWFWFWIGAHPVPFCTPYAHLSALNIFSEDLEARIWRLWAIGDHTVLPVDFRAAPQLLITFPRPIVPDTHYGDTPIPLNREPSAAS